MIKKLAPYLSIILIDAFGFSLAYPVLAALFASRTEPSLLTYITNVNTAISLTFLLYPLGLLFGAAWLGDISDNYGRVKTLKFSLLGLGIGFALTGIGISLSSMVLLCVGRIFSGFMAGSQAIAQAGVANLKTTHTKAVRLSIASLFMSLGFMLGPFSGGVIASMVSFSAPFYTATLLALLATMLTLTMKNDERSQPTQAIQWARPFTTAIKAAKYHALRRVAMSFLLMQIGFSAYYQYIAIHLRFVHHYKAFQLGLFQSVLGLGFAIGLLIGMPVMTKKYSIKTIATFGLVLTGVGILIAAALHQAVLQWPLALVIAITDIMTLASIFTLFSDVVKPDQQGWAMGVASTVIAISWIISALAANFISFYNTQWVILVGGLLLILSAIHLKRLLVPKR